ncbi:hypothetical protein GBA52_000450 [Prunus armeniaca]|nr:hypothetical protein GBA52_000450 [Prunus armeniaca]
MVLMASKQCPALIQLLAHMKRALFKYSNGRLLTVNRSAPRGTRKKRPPRSFEPAF